MIQGDLFARDLSAPGRAPVIVRPPLAVAPLPARLPRRLQRSRKRGAKIPPGAAWVGRPTINANPFHSKRFGHARSVLMYGDWLEGRLSDLDLERRGFCPAEIDALHRLRLRVLDRLPRLRRKDLVCWCPLTSRWCHADILIKHANEDLPAGWQFEARTC